MTEELLYFNGVNGDTGDYDLDPMTADRLFDVLSGVAEPENIKELEYRVQWETENIWAASRASTPPKLKKPAGV